MINSFNSMDEAYVAISQCVLSFPNRRPWDQVVGKFEIIENMVSISWLLVHINVIHEKWNGRDSSRDSLACDATLYLREKMLRISQDKIWGLTFTLKPNGKFKIDYDYNKPQGYEKPMKPLKLTCRRAVKAYLNAL